jgi:ABC-type transport system involved in multi-copper enzyme maturation permease subunit
MRAVYSIAINTFREAIRNKILYSIIVFAVVVILAGNFLADISLHNDKRVLYDLGIGFLSTFGLLLALFTGTNLIYKEIDKKTIYLLLAKPVSRTQFLLGKMWGVVTSIYLVLILMFILLILESIFVGTGVHINLYKAAILILFEVLVVVSITTLFSSFSTPFITGMLSFGFIIIGRLLPDLKQIIAMKYNADGARSAVEHLLQLFPQLYLFTPNGHDFNGRHLSITADFVTWDYIGYSGLYAILYSSVILLLASTIFKRRDLM